MDSNATSRPNYLERVFALDLRSLALFRVSLGFLILWDLWFRWPTLSAMYTGDGVYGRPLSFDYFRGKLGEDWNQYIWSLYWLSDSPEFTTALFSISALAAFFLIAGKWTKTATVVSWLLLASLHTRNPLVTTSADFAFKMMLFWSIFLPLGAKWSLDSKHYRIGGNSVVSIATIGYIVQLFALYFFPGIAKWNEIWFSGDAMSYVLRLDIYITEFGRSLLNYPGILKFVSWVTLAAEVFWIWTLFSPWKNEWFRMINMTLFWLFHFGIAMSMSIGLFPWICMIAWLPLIPSVVWQRQYSPQTNSYLNWNRIPMNRLVAEIFCLTALMLVVLWNISNIEHAFARKLRVPLLSQFVHQLAIDQHFQMFGIPPKQNPWFVYEAHLANGSQIDIFRKQEVDLNRPEWGRRAFPQFHWRKLHRNALQPENAFIRQPLLDYAVEKWNSEHSAEKQVVRARLMFFKEDIGPDYNDKNFHSIVWGSYRDKSKGPGSLFESLANESGDPSF